MKVSCDKLGLIWDNYVAVATKILSDKNLGKFVFVETLSGEVIAFLFVTYEWSDWRDGIFFWLQAIEILEGHEEAVQTLKNMLETYASTELGFKWCGLRLCNQKTKSKHFEPAVKAFGLEQSHYYIFHINTK